MTIFWLSYCNTGMVGVTIGGNWARRIWDHLFVLFLTTVCESTIIFKMKKNKFQTMCKFRRCALGLKASTCLLSVLGQVTSSRPNSLLKKCIIIMQPPTGCCGDEMRCPCDLIGVRLLLMSSLLLLFIANSQIHVKNKNMCNI